MALVAAANATAAQAAPKVRPAIELINPFLGPDLSHWLVGPIARLASEEDIDAYLVLADDAGAEAFIEAFWSRQSDDLRGRFEERAELTDRKFTESHHDGRRTDRGTIYILYGPPEKITYEEFRDVSDPDVELWTYPKKREPGLDGRRPERQYRFAKEGDLTTFFKPMRPDDPRRRMYIRQQPPSHR